MNSVVEGGIGGSNVNWSSGEVIANLGQRISNDSGNLVLVIDTLATFSLEFCNLSLPLKPLRLPVLGIPAWVQQSTANGQPPVGSFW